jgi:hypothetical protein
MIRPAHLLVDIDGVILRANQELLTLVELPPQVVGSPLSTLRLERLGIPGRRLIEQAVPGGAPVLARCRAPSPDDRCFCVMVRAISSAGRRLGTSISVLEEAPGPTGGRDEALLAAVRHLRLLAAELRAANGELRTDARRLRDARDELLETRVTLETAAVDLLTRRAARLAELAASRASLKLGFAPGLVRILEDLQIATGIVDRDLRVVAWNRLARERWGPAMLPVPAATMARLDTRLSPGELLEPVNACLHGRSSRERRHVHARDPSGHEVTASAVCLPLRSDGGQIAGVLVVIDGE